MNTKILIIRHAKSIASDIGMFGGITDYELSEEGICQANALALRLKKIKIDKIYSSPLKRAVNTISPISKIKKLDINIVDDLKDIYVGTWENVPVDELRRIFPEENKYIDETEFYTGIEGQEETIEVSNRMYNAILNIAKENRGKTVVVVSHIVPIRAFLCKIMNIPFEKTKEKIGDLKNTSICEIIYNNNENKFVIKNLK